jgi:signal peptidase I
MLLVTATLVSALAAAAWLTWARRRLVVVVVEGSSMLPTYRPGDRVLVRRTSLGRIRSGQVLVLRRPKTARDPPMAPSGVRLDQQSWIIKRAAALPGEPCPVAMLPAESRSAEADACVPDGWLAVLGDNSASSADSREFGLVPADFVLGAVVRRLPAGG